VFGVTVRREMADKGPEDLTVAAARRPAAAARTQHADLAVVLALTLGTGAVDAVSYFSLNHVFTANMSGNIALLGIGLVKGPGAVMGNVFAFAGFILGSIAAARLLRMAAGTPTQRARRMLLIELGLLIAVTGALAGLNVNSQASRQYAICLVLAAAMGIQTAVARLLAVSDVNTTVATMTLHDLAAGSRLGGGDSLRWRRRAAVVVALFVGAAIGVGLDQLTPAGGLTFACLIVSGAVLGTVDSPSRRRVLAMANAQVGGTQ
jgi:uncharacterized membrane protein YoaK (UPF0700 family)